MYETVKRERVTNLQFGIFEALVWYAVVACLEYL